MKSERRVQDGEPEHAVVRDLRQSCRCHQEAVLRAALHPEPVLELPHQARARFGGWRCPHDGSSRWISTPPFSSHALPWHQSRGWPDWLPAGSCAPALSRPRVCAISLEAATPTARGAAAPSCTSPDDSGAAAEGGAAVIVSVPSGEAAFSARIA